MEKSKLELKLSEMKESENNSGKWEHYTFKAYKGAKPIAHIAIDRVKEVKDPKISDDHFFMDFDFDPQRPRPYLFYMGTEEAYKGMGIAGRLIEFANEYFKKQYDTPLHSGTSNMDDAIKVWERLVNHGEAVEYTYDNKRRWKML